MFKTTLNMIAGALICALVSAALAVTGTPPVNGYQTPDGTWLNGLAGGVNFSTQSGITAAGTTQATGTVLPSGIFLVEVDTAAASTGVNLPPCFIGTAMQLYNNGANTLTIYPAVANNPVAAAQDTINNSTSTTQATHTSKIYYCAKAGVWAAQ